MSRMLLVLTLGLAACAADGASTLGCVSRGSMHWGVVVLDRLRDPVTGLSLVDSVPRTGMEFVVAQPLAENDNGMGEPPGHYAILDDSLGPSFLRGTGDSLVVSGTSPRAHFRAGYYFGPTNGACSYGKIAGPDTVIAE